MLKFEMNNNNKVNAVVDDDILYDNFIDQLTEQSYPYVYLIRYIIESITWEFNISPDLSCVIFNEKLKKKYIYKKEKLNKLELQQCRYEWNISDIPEYISMLEYKINKYDKEIKGTLKDDKKKKIFIKKIKKLLEKKNAELIRNEYLYNKYFKIWKNYENHFEKFKKKYKLNDFLQLKKEIKKIHSLFIQGKLTEDSYKCFPFDPSNWITTLDLKIDWLFLCKFLKPIFISKYQKNNLTIIDYYRYGSINWKNFELPALLENGYDNIDFDKFLENFKDAKNLTIYGKFFKFFIEYLYKEIEGYCERNSEYLDDIMKNYYTKNKKC